MTISRKKLLEIAPEHPPVSPPHVENIPLELRERPQWVAWRWERRTQKKGERKWTKVPVNPRTGGNAQPNNPTTWGTFAEALHRYEEGRHSDKLHGIGFMFSDDDPYCGVDFDDAFYPESQTVAGWARGWVDRLDSYAELSPTFTGLKCFLRARCPGKHHKGALGDGEVEVYDQGRFFTVTGVVPPGMELHGIHDRQEQLDALYKEVFASREAKKAARKRSPLLSVATNGSAAGSLTDDQVIEKASHARNGEKFRQLWNGDTSGHGDDDSAADLALCNLLRFRTGGDRQQMDRLFRRSGLMRDKWDERRGEQTYGERTLDLAMGGEVYDPIRSRQQPPSGGAAPEPGVAPGVGSEVAHLTDTGNAIRLIRSHGNDLRYCDPWKKWLCYGEGRWQLDRTREIDRRARRTIQDFRSWAEQQLTRAENQEDKDRLQAVIKHCHGSESASAQAAMIRLAASVEGIPIVQEALDQDPWLFNCSNGTLNLQSGDFRGHRRHDYLTKICPLDYDADAKCPLWEQTLLKIFAGKQHLVSYVQRLAGYALTGDVREHLFPVFWGTGSNGKGLLFEMIRHVMGKDYASTGANELLMASQHEPHPTYLADLFGKRLVTVSETRERGQLKETQVKQLTGEDGIKARRMREDFWEFCPTHKIWLATNHKPQIRGTDHGIWRRLRLIPFEVLFWDPQKNEEGPEELKADKTLKDRLKEEAPGILAWMVRGCRDWLSNGMREPPEVTEATKEYRTAEDLVGCFLEEVCELKAFGSEATVASVPEEWVCPAGRLYAVFKDWCETRRESKVPSLTKFGEDLTSRGVQKRKSNGVKYLGVKIRRNDDQPKEETGTLEHSGHYQSPAHAQAHARNGAQPGGCSSVPKCSKEEPPPWRSPAPPQDSPLAEQIRRDASGLDSDDIPGLPPEDPAPGGPDLPLQ